jgi:ferritin-like metal-binding protein YciE
MTITSVDQLFVQELKDIYDAEKRLTKALPKMAKAAGSEELREAITGHLAETKEQVTRLERIFSLLEVKAQGKTCAGMKGLIEEGEEVAGQQADEPFGDIGLIGAARRVEHYEMAGYLSLIDLAKHLEQEEIQSLLEETLEEEQEADRKLAELAETMLEESSSAEDEDDEEDEEVEDEEAEDEEEAAPTPARKR